MNKILIANWKMQLDQTQSIALAKQYKQKLGLFNNVEVAAAPSYLYLTEIAEIFKGTRIKLAAQNVAIEKKGALTGEISAQMLKQIGCHYVIIGHSERRHKLGETDEQINQKIQLAFQNNLVPILCIGETMEEKNVGQRDAVLAKQIRNALNKVSALPAKKIIIAYEPVWAIGSGKNLDAREMSAISLVIKRHFSTLYTEKFFQEKVRLLYGGSTNSQNAQDYLSLDCVDGLLVGGASLDADEFFKITKAA